MSPTDPKRRPAPEEEVADFIFKEEAHEEPKIVFEEDPEETEKRELAAIAARVSRGNEELALLRDFQKDPKKFKPLLEARGIKSEAQLAARLLDVVQETMQQRIQLAAKELEGFGERAFAQPLKIGQPVWVPEGRGWVEGKVVTFSQALGRYEVATPSGAQVLSRRRVEGWQTKDGQQKQLEIWEYEGEALQAQAAKKENIDKLGEAAKAIAERATSLTDTSTLLKMMGDKKRY